MCAIETIDEREARRIKPPDTAIHFPARDAFKTNVFVRESKSASLIERYHRKDAVHSDGCAGCQAAPQKFKPVSPQLCPEAGAA